MPGSPARVAVATVAFSGLLCCLANAQDEPADPKPPGTPTSERARVIEEIVVTAQKKEEGIQDVPISITALTGEFLADAGVDDVHELTEFTPNVRFATNETVFVRGIGSPFGGSSFDPSVGLALDEMSIASPQFLSDPVYAIERFEILRGPQGTLFGKNTPAGLFNVTTARPTRELSGHLLARAGGLDVHRLEAAIGGLLGPLGDLAHFRFAFVEANQEEDVFNTKLDQGEPDAQQRAARFKLTVEPLDGLEVLFIGSRATTDAWIFHAQAHMFPDSSVEFLRRYDREFEDDALNHQTSSDGAERWEKDTDLLQTNVTFDAGDLGPLRGTEVVAVLGQTGFDLDRPTDADLSPANLLNLDPYLFNYDPQSAELRFSGTAPAPLRFGEIEFLVGALIFDSNLLSDLSAIAGPDIDEYLLSDAAFELVTGAPPPGGVGFQSLTEVANDLGVTLPPGFAPLAGDGIHFLLDQDLSSQAVFGRAAWHLLDHWTVSFGARYTREKKDARIRSECFGAGLICAAFGVQPFAVTEERTETDFSPKMTLEYRPFDDLMLFASRSQGFKSGGFNNFNFSAADVEVEPEKTVNWEVGAKGRLLDGSLSYGVTLFHMDVDDIQVQILTGTFLVVQNAASARTRGVELDAEWLTPWEPLSIRGAGAFTDARFVDYPNAPAPVASGADTQDLSGRRMPYSPKTQVSVTPAFRFPFTGPALPLVGRFVGRDLVLTTAFDVLYRSSSFLDGDLDPNLKQDGYAMLDARLSLAAAGEALTLGLIVKNATNTDVLDLGIDSPLFPRGYSVTQENQRNYVFALSFRW